MKSLVAAVILSAAFAAPAAHAAPSGSAAPTNAMASRYTCESGGLQHVSFQAAAAPCCKGSFSCPQLLSITGLAKTRFSGRT